MTLQEFKQTLQQNIPPAGTNVALQALWYEAKGDWNAAHDICQQSSPALDWVHAYLHRKEGDASNAAYWYRRAGKPVAKVSLDEEWDAITQSLLVG